MGKTLITKLHYYSFDVRDLGQRISWERLQDKLRENAAFCMKILIHSGLQLRTDVETVKLDLTHVFNNQWNEAGEEGRRLFDWILYSRIGSTHWKEGYWLEITDEMQRIRDITFKCGYCGSSCVTPDYNFCNQCIDSEYLKEEDLYLLRLLSVSSRDGVRAPLSDAEKAELVPLYRKAQGLGKLSRARPQIVNFGKEGVALVPNAVKEAKDLVERARIKAEAHTWLLDNNFQDPGNVIYYSSERGFCFGWRDPLSEKEREYLKILLKAFPFKYKLK